MKIFFLPKYKKIRDFFRLHLKKSTDKKNWSWFLSLKTKINKYINKPIKKEEGNKCRQKIKIMFVFAQLRAVCKKKNRT